MTTAKQRKFNIEDYDYYVREYIKKSEVELAHKLAQKIMKNVC